MTAPAPRIHALLVGINAYRNVKPLHGCVDDVAAIEAILRERAGSALQLRTLTDLQATRAAIIDGFRMHLAQAAAGDIALFYFCGHGSQEPCPAEWKALEPSGMLQTIVPVDARADGVFDIADKELVALIAEVAATGAQVVTIFDSCHSGGVTRDATDDPASDTTSRMAPSTMAPRTMTDYLEAAVALYAPERRASAGVPDPARIEIAACQHFETAKEQPLQPPRRGTFTAALEEVLRSLGPSATYADLIRSVRARVLTRASGQMPMLTVCGNADATTLFLGGAAGRSDLTIDIDDTGALWLNAGTVGGLVSQPRSGASTEVAIHLRGALDDRTARPSPIATATVSEALTDRARLKLVGTATLDRTQSYIGVITRLGTPHLTVVVSGEPASAVASVSSELALYSGRYEVVPQAVPGIPSITAQVSADATMLLDASGTPLRNQRFAHDTDGIDALINAVRHLSRWYGIRDSSPVSSRYNGAVTIDVLPVEQHESLVTDDRAPRPVIDGIVTVPYLTEHYAKAVFRVRNTTSTRLFVVLVNLAESLRSAVLFRDWLPAGGVGYYGPGGQAVELTVPAWKGSDAVDSSDILKVFASTSAIDSSELEMKGLLNQPSVVGTRNIMEKKAVDTSFWGTTTLRVVTRR